MKKIAVLILCHKDASQINLLINQFDENLYDIYIHCDLKMKDISRLSNKDNVFICEKRFDVKWAHISMVLAELELLRMAKNKDYLYFRLISGQDLLIKSSIDAYNFLNRNANRNYFKLIREDLRKFIKRNEVIYPSFLFKNTLLIKIIRNIYLVLTGGRRHTFRIFKRKFSNEYKFVFSSEFFTITQDAVSVIFSFLDDNPDYIKEFSKSICPDECFFSTIICNSSLKDTVIDDNLLYVDFSEGNASPKILKNGDYMTVMSSKYFVARKFDNNVDSDIIKRIIEK